MKKEFTTTLSQPFLTLETTGLSPQKDSICSIGLIDCKNSKCVIYLCDDLAFEGEMIQNFLCDYGGESFITWEGNNFSKRFFQERCRFYGIQSHISFYNFSQKVRDFSFLFPFSSLSRSALEDYFRLPPSIGGKQMAKKYTSYLKKEISEGDLCQEAVEKLTAFSRLHNALCAYFQNQLSFSVREKYFELTSLKKDDHLALFTGKAPNQKDLFLSTSSYVLSIEEEIFQLELPMQQSLYDDRICSYILREDFYNLTFPSHLSSPAPIFILYLDNWIYPHVKALMEHIFSNL